MAHGAFGYTPYSARVELWLEGAFGRIRLREVGHNFIVPFVPTHLPPCEAVLTIMIDDEPQHYDVCLVNGMSEDDTESATQIIEPAPF